MTRWVLKNIKINEEEFAREHQISPVIAKLLINRGIIQKEKVATFLEGTPTALYSPEQMKDVKKAVMILKEKLEKNEKIRVIGDYDVDGIISTYILYTALKTCGANVDYEIPDRIKDGYGVSKKLVDRAIKSNIDTIVTCDNGIAAKEALEYAKDNDITCIITDHHNVPFIENEKGERIPQLPKVDAVINPKQEECEYPFKELCGAGVALKLIQQLYKEVGFEANKYIEFVEFVAIATVCDVVDLIDENRIIVKEGLKRINTTTNIGLRELLKASMLEDKKVTAYHLGYVIGPTLNATGRLDTANEAIKLLDSKNKTDATTLAINFVALNAERKEMTIEGTQQAITEIEARKNQKEKVLVVHMPDVHESLAGIIAGRLKEKYYKPTIVLTDVEEGVKGSGRSIEVYDMFEELSKCKELLTKFGGHPMAAGLSLSGDNVALLSQKLNAQTTMREEELIPKLTLDMGVRLEQINEELVEQIENLEPFGKANPTPIFGDKNIKIVAAELIGKNKNVLRLNLLSSNRRYFKAIYFGDLKAFEQAVINRYDRATLEALYRGAYVDVFLDIAFEVSFNEFRGNKSIQIVIQKFR